MQIRGNILFILLGVFIGLLIRRQPNQQPVTAFTAQPRTRSVEELSPTYHKLRAAEQSIYDVDESQVHTYLWNIAHEMIRPNLTDAEAANVAKEIGNLLQSMDSYKELRKRKLDYQDERWIDELEEQR